MVKAKSLRVGDRVEVIANGANHNQPIGSVFTFKCMNSGYVQVNEVPQSFLLADLNAYPVTKEGLEKRINNSEKRIADIQSEIESDRAKIAFLAEVGVDTYSENEFKAYQTLKLLEQADMSTIQRAKAIASLFNN